MADQRTFKVNGKVARLRDSWVLEDRRDARRRPSGAQAERPGHDQDRGRRPRSEGQEGPDRDPRAVPRRGRARSGPHGEGQLVDHEYEIDTPATDRRGVQEVAARPRHLRRRGLPLAMSSWCLPSPWRSAGSPTTDATARPTPPLTPRPHVERCLADCAYRGMLSHGHTRRPRSARHGRLPRARAGRRRRHARAHQG